jgi:hypothetical protein
MDPLVQMIVDILRRGKETDAVNQGGSMNAPQASMPAMPQGVQPKHGGQTYDNIIAGMSQ